MFSDIATVRTALKERLTPALPVGWEINENLTKPPTEYRKPLITFEFTRFASTAGGQALGPGQVAAMVDLVLGSPKTTDAGEDEVDQLALSLVQAIDKQSDMFWADAEKQRFDTGQWVWRIHTTVLTTSKE